MELELKSALDAVQTAAGKLSAASAAFEDAQKEHAAAIEVAKAAHEKLTALVASIIPGVGTPKRVL